jgi:hypothetical protein
MNTQAKYLPQNTAFLFLLPQTTAKIYRKFARDYRKIPQNYRNYHNYREDILPG